MSYQDQQNTKRKDLTDDLLEWLRSYAKERINSRLIDERRCIPPYIVLDFGNRGLLGMQVLPKYGGIGLSNQDTLRLIQQLGAIDATLASFVGVHNFLGIRPLMNYASDNLKDELLPHIATGRELAAFALTEQGAGSNPQAISAKAIPDSRGGWKLQGNKIWIGSAAWASTINTFVQTFDNEGQYLGISGFVVRQGSKGLRQGLEALTMGLRGMVQNAVHLDDVSVDSENLLGELGAGMKVAQDAMMYGRLCITAVSLGGMKRCAQLILRYAKRRNISTGRLINNPVTLVKLTTITEHIMAVESLVTRIAVLLDGGSRIPIEAYAACKIIGSEFFWQAADSLVQMLGGRGYIETNIAPQLLRDSRILRIYEGPTETLNMFIGSRINVKNEELYQFICHGLETPQIAEDLRIAVEQIKDRYTNSGFSFADKNTASRWLYACTGEITTLGIVLAAVEGAFERSGSKRLHRTVTWAKLCFEQKLERILSGTPAELVMSDPETINDIIGNYSYTIGDIEQTLSGESHSLDEMLYC
ncbi:MAG: acyl-CoA/acyl-ACP dehydrogenase [Okeania sp. SIO3H1]|uniref:acyl-CoA dehydrogenase family protein n=1 Tax=Okeania sp. SIO1I7 TaxID=2607772 RepID=UPI0013CC173E|nr:acyl-CoA dehydrogenase family protein [Okeania sp. SIO1I7]NEN90975.1 acyl-CoA/acyl-ACP dehydrogenase [Okeania sp. SIO3H1]NET28988.1 acyl-CoA/acyl-ACP dehydrogenase [Okeania sp. SIO1I7]